MYHYFKRGFDFLFSLLLLPFFLFALLIIGPLVYLSDKGSCIYYSPRIGKNGKTFIMYKFRTMITNAPDVRLEDGSTYNADDDPRVTKVGRFLRKTSMDEIPQILNVFLGNMSFIGPRPDPVDWLDHYREKDMVILKVRPGITGYSQAYYRNSVEELQKKENDIYYAENVSLILDLRILFKTIHTVIFQKNINRC